MLGFDPWVLPSQPVVSLLNHVIYPTVTAGLEEAKQVVKIRTPIGHTLIFHEK